MSAGRETRSRIDPFVHEPTPTMTLDAEHNADVWKDDCELAERERANPRATGRRERLETMRVHEGDPAARLPFFDVATLIAGTYPPDPEEKR